MIEDDDDLVTSKSQIKREMQALRDLGKELVDLPVSVVKKFDLPEAVYEAVTLADNIFTFRHSTILLLSRAVRIPYNNSH